MFEDSDGTYKSGLNLPAQYQYWDVVTINDIVVMKNL